MKYIILYLTRFSGEASVVESGSKSVKPSVGMTLHDSDVISTGRDAQVYISLGEKNVVKLSEGSRASVKKS